MELERRRLTAEMIVPDTGESVRTEIEVRIDPLTGHSSRILPDRGLMPANAKAFDDIIAEVKGKNDAYMTNVFEIWKVSLSEDAYTPPHIAQWIEFSNAAYPEFQKAILGQETPKEALDAVEKKATTIMEDAGLLK